VIETPASRAMTRTDDIYILARPAELTSGREGKTVAATVSFLYDKRIGKSSQHFFAAATPTSGKTEPPRR
jgi:hypothetical protein